MKQSYSKLVNKRDSSGKGSTESATLAQLRSDQSLLLAAYSLRTDKTTDLTYIPYDSMTLRGVHGNRAPAKITEKLK